MTKYLVSAALAAAIGAATFAAPASADPNVGFSINVGPDRPHYGYGYSGPRYYHSGPRYYHSPGVRVYTGRSSYEDCRTVVRKKWVNGKRIETRKRICD